MKAKLDKTYVPVSFKFEADLLRRIDEISGREERSRSFIVRKALVRFVNSRIATESREGKRAR